MRRYTPASQPPSSTSLVRRVLGVQLLVLGGLATVTVLGAILAPRDLDLRRPLAWARREPAPTPAPAVTRPRVAPRLRPPTAPPGLYPLTYPVLGPVLGAVSIAPGLIGRYGDPRGGGRDHAGVDLAAPKLTPVVAVADGVVSWIHGPRGAQCCALSLLHDDGWHSRYVHLNNDTPGTDDGRGTGIRGGLREGDRVSAGDVLGWVGDSGNAEATPPHLHFELRDPIGTPVDPWPSLLHALGGG